MQVPIMHDELYPYFDIVTSEADMRFAQMIDVDDETFARWRSVLDQFKTVQTEMRTAYGMDA